MEIYAPLFQTFMALADQCGKPVNYGRLAQELSMTLAAAKLRTQKLAGMDLIILIPALRNQTKGNRVRGDTVYLKHPDSQMLRFPELRKKLKNPTAISVARIHERETRQHPQSRFYHCTSYSGTGIGVVVQRRDFRFGITILERMSFTKQNVRILRSAVKEGTLRRGFVLYPTYRAFFVGRGILAVPMPVFLATYEHWTDAENTNTDFRLLTRWINRF